MKISLIAAIDEERGIGKNNDLLFKIPGDLPRFKKLTLGHTIIMGRKTYESIGRPLPNRTNIVITRDKSFHPDGVIVVHSFEEALSSASKISNGVLDDSVDEIFIIGGGQIFTEAIKIADRLYVTLVHGKHNADVFFPEYSEFTKVISEESHESGEYVFRILEKE